MSEGRRTICPYCGVGCGLAVDTDVNGRVSRVRGDPAHVGTRGKLCRKAVYLPQAVNALFSCSAPFLAINPADALELGIGDGDTAEVVATQRGSVCCRRASQTTWPPGPSSRHSTGVSFAIRAAPSMISPFPHSTRFRDSRASSSPLLRSGKGWR